MNHIALDKLRFYAKLLMTILAVLTLSMFAVHSQAAQTDAVDTTDKTQARFDHMTTGFPLTGAHAIADCGSCHVGGVFKGTPRNCNGCHIKGQRIVAIDMPAIHIPTTERCDVCHTNTVTFFGAYYNHGLAVPGQCTSCHNGSVTTGRPSSHNIVPKATAACDNCHRATAWLPSFYLHTGVSGNCSSCHLNAQVVEAANIRNSISGTSPEAFAHGVQNSSLDCNSCHTNFSTWYGAMYDHATAGTPCSNCHNSSRATGTAQFSGHVSIGTSDCSTCHSTTTTWLGALGGMPSNHVSSAYFQPPTISCSTCHPTPTTWITGSTLHSYLVSSPCARCHLTGTNVLGTQTNNHHQPTDCGASGCHSSFTSWNK